MHAKSPRDTARPVLVIAGRPNVGKSAVFNRLIGRRLAIVHEESGVTRDRLVCEAEWCGKRFDLVDTGGIPGHGAAAARDPIQAGIRQQVETALDDASGVLLVVNAASGLHPLDSAVADVLRRRGIPVLVAANKCDHPDHDARAFGFERLGFPVYPVSALHDRGWNALMQAAVRDLPEGPPADGGAPLRVAIVGRPNTGKSSYLNRLLRSDRVLVSALPGTTRDSVDVPFAIGSGPCARRYVLTDTAGMRQKGRVDTAVERYSLMRAEESIANADVCVLLLDGAQGPTVHDKKIAALIREHAKGCVILVNKWDLLADVSTQREYQAALCREVPFLEHVPVVFTSALSGYNIRRTIDAIDHVAAQVQIHISTGLLNRVVLEAYERKSPPAIGGKRLKLYYAVQVGTKPIRIRLFVNHPTCVVATYEQYLVGALRRAFGFEGAPVRVEWRERPSERSRDSKSQHTGNQ